jgi:hypothetical protein
MLALEQVFYKLLEQFAVVGKAVHFPVMMGIFIVGVTARWLIHRTVKRHHGFAKTFEFHVSQFLAQHQKSNTTKASFYLLVKKILERSYFESIARRQDGSKSPHTVALPLDDRIFLTRFGCAWFVKELLKQVRHLQHGPVLPKLDQITRAILSRNPVFGKVLGLIPAGGLNDFLNILPGLFVIGGIFGTFLGVMNGLPSLGGMSVENPEQTKQIMDAFLRDVAMSMGASVTGILLSVLMTLINTTWSPERLHDDMVERFENSLDLLWNFATSNEVPSDVRGFDETQDPVEALSAAALNQEYDKHRARFGDAAESTAKSA